MDQISISNVSNIIGEYTWHPIGDKIVFDESGVPVHLLPSVQLPECQSNVNSRGDVEIIIDYDDGRQERREIRNTLLRKGKVALAKSLANDVADPYDFFIQRMLFGTSGTASGTPKFVDETRNGLFGTTLVNKSVISSVDESAPTTAIFTSVVTFSEGNGSSLNEMLLQMSSGDAYSMITFPDLGKTSSMQLTFNWRISFL